MTTAVARSFVICVLLLFGCQTLRPDQHSSPVVRHASIDGIDLKYVEQGQGATVVFVHGAFSDHRVWDAQRDPVARRYRYIALDQRYFGSAPWPDNGAKYSLATHASDLARFVGQLNGGPVHLVSWSYGGNIALAVAVQHPQLVRTLFLYEPALASMVSDAADVRTLGEERQGLGASVAASKENDQPRAVRLFAEWVNAQPGGFDSLRPSLRAVFLENSRTLPPHFSAPPPSPITCSQLGRVNVPVTVAKGEQTRPFFAILADTTHRCVPGSKLVTIPNARHMAPAENTAGFNEALLTHLSQR